MSCSRWLGRVFNAERGAAASELPLYLCPGFRFLSGERAAVRRPCRPPPGGRFARSRQLHTEMDVSPLSPAKPPHPVLKTPPYALNLQCHGCGALSQTVAAGEPGYYDLSRKIVKEYLGLDVEKEDDNTPRRPNADEIVQQALKAIDIDALDRQGIDLKGLLPERTLKTAPAAKDPPLCDRCHNLAHHSTGNSIYHPSIESLHDTIEESPYKVNHVYHVLDAADFPMSLIPRLHSLLDVSLRSQNRRSKPVKYQHGRLTEMSFIITRSDLLAPKKEQVDALMPYLKETLRGALGRIGARIRLGNVHCVSARNGWWTRELKETIWERGGAGWLVGKANVGKSRLFGSVLPQGRMDEEPSKHNISVNVFPRAPTKQQEKEAAASNNSNPLLPGHTTDLSDDKPSFLTPLRPETNYPAMPLVSSLPGTTASPIRVPYGSGRGELIDLPGLARSDLELHVREDKRQHLVMKSRVVPQQQVIKPGQSLVLGGGLIRLTPRNTGGPNSDGDDELVFLAYAFTPIEPHLTATHKAIALQEEKWEDAPEVESIAAPGTGAKIAHAGAFQVRYDVTKKRTGPLTTKVGVGLKVEQLPYRVLGIDILIEGCGWVEIAVQVRTKQLFPKRDPFSVIGDQLQELDLRPEPVNAPKEKEGKNNASGLPEAQPRWPVIDVYSPEGKFVGYRPPMSAWVLNKPRKVDAKRPRKSMKGVKKMEKRERRAQGA